MKFLHFVGIISARVLSINPQKPQFGNLQKQAAIQLGASQEWITAANASGATSGKMISPQSISIATVATGLSGSEGKIFAATIKYCIIYMVLMGLLVYAFSFK